MPRRDSPSSRRSPARPVLIAVVVACAALLAVPASTPRGEVLDLVSDAGLGPGVASGQEPTPEGPATAAPAPVRVTTSSTPRARLGADPPTPMPASMLTGYAWPIAHPRLTQPFGPSPWADWVVAGRRFHDGIDLATFCGDRITAAHDGIILAAGRHFDELLGWVGDLGPYFARLDRKGLWATLPIVVVVDDGNGYRSIYAHFGRLVVRSGQEVRAGQLLGYEGATGHASGCHLHYSLFSPWEPATYTLKADVAKRMRLPRAETARIDPLLVLPFRRGISARSGAGSE